MTMAKKKEVKKEILIKYDLGCGQNKQEGHIGVDIAKAKGVDIVYDLTKFPYKFAKTGVVNEIFTSHFVEHLDGAERMRFMDECYRMLVKGGKLTILVPYYASMRAVQDPTHKWPPISESSFLYFNKGWREQNKLDHYPIKCDFDFSYGYMLDPNWASRSDESRYFATKQYINVVNDIQVVLIRR